MIKVRFAPSPTGYLHIGGARTALFNWLYARHAGGKFILRIEDTDLARSKKEYLDEILESLAWLGMDWDDLYYQSRRFDIYRDYAARLLSEGRAYTAENGAIIFKVGEEEIKINDLIRGEIKFDAGLIKDQVLIKEDKSPTYNFACVVDDALLGITHVLRGDDHISNTPKQVVLYKALDFKVPDFAHLPLIMGKDGGRLSKRTGATAISEWRKMGYLPESLANYLLLLGWSPGANQEIIPIGEAVKKFEIKNVNKTAAVFDSDKLQWLNAQYIKQYDPGKLCDLLIPQLKEAGFVGGENFNREEIISVVKLFQSRISTLADFVDFVDFVFLDNPKFNPDAKEKLLNKDLSKEFNLLARRFDKIKDFNAVNIEEEFRNLVKELGIKAKELVHPVRAAISGKTVGPGLFETMALLGKEKIKARLNMAEKMWKSAPNLKCFILLFAVVFISGLFSGCGTVKGAYQGAKEDWKNLQKWDDKFRETWW
ncbi:MAG: glutamate--tRNA ligase [Candidatus Omnitrophica bacterium CG11_big_fil_rev_8_21_14_0_20_42_13]|uniref:Glutamate--tRNA ligase n=1 Tax=Candidatus Ghiorseimicrobium undicola TaxID=1974746 RepID=A0A2H0LX10_9BACT|nr:MAG: glutamate--tRNA ligase [Candidatus Omnitrophica bacterium CG11_big_fil_rev_8_21_14_0_20_42_13]